MLVVGGAEIGTAFLYVVGQSQTFAENQAFCALTGVLASILAFKMFVNIH